MDRSAFLARHGTALIPGEPWARWTFVALLALAAGLRFWNLPNLPYTHDELSALVRLYPTLGETIQRGVIELDTHPPGVQVLEWVWTKVFSVNEADVKLPFILMSLSAMLLLYRFAMAWAGAGPALVLAAIMAATQYGVMYGQIARPYAVGLFTTALLADQLTRYLAFGSRKTLVWTGVAALLSAYTHHFALLLAGLMMLTGLMMVDAGRRKEFLITCGIAGLFYLPNIPIFFKQLSLGGLGEWLPAPDAGWFGAYGWFIAHNSVLLAALLCGAVAWSMALAWRERKSEKPATCFLWIWGIVPLTVGFLYSVWRAPVLQYSVVLFSFPYLVLALLIGLRHLQRNATLVLVSAITLVAVHSLVNVRHHYTLFYTSKYVAVLRNAQAALAEYGPTRTRVLIDAPDNVTRFYLKKWNVSDRDFPYIPLREWMTDGKVDSILRVDSGKVIVYGTSNGADPEMPARIQEHFPYLLQRRDLVDGQLFRFSSTVGAQHWFDRDTIASIVVNGPRSGAWRVADDLPVITENDISYWDFNGREFGLTIDLPFDSIIWDPREQIEIVVQVAGWESGTRASIIADVQRADSTVFYRGGDLVSIDPKVGNAAMIVALKRADVREPAPVLLKAYIYNPGRTALRVHRVDVLRRQANVVQYGTLDPVPWLGRFR